MQQLTPVVILAKQAPKKLSREGRASPTTADATEQLQQGTLKNGGLYKFGKYKVLLGGQIIHSHLPLFVSSQGNRDMSLLVRHTTPRLICPPLDKKKCG